MQYIRNHSQQHSRNEKPTLKTGHKNYLDTYNASMHPHTKRTQNSNRQKRRINSSKNSVKLSQKQASVMPIDNMHALAKYIKITKSIKQEIVEKTLGNKQSELNVKNSLIYKKLLVEYEETKKQFNLQKVALEREISQLEIEYTAHQQQISTLKGKREKLRHEVTVYTDQLEDLQQRNYEMYWDICAEYEFLGANQESEYEELLNLDQQNVSKGLDPDSLQDFMIANTKTKHLQTDQSYACCICCECLLMSEQFIQLACCHIFHSCCLQSWLKVNKICPLCRNQINEE